MPTEVTVSDIADWNKLITQYLSYDRFSWIFRGQADSSWVLVPKAGRPEYNIGRDIGRFNDWSDHAVAYGALPTNSWERLP